MPQSTSIDTLLEQMIELSASDLHYTVGTTPAFRVHGRIRPLEGAEILDADMTRQTLYGILTSEQQKQLELNRQFDFAYSLPGVARFRVNVFFQRGAIGAAFRLVPGEIKTLDELGLPPVLHTLAKKPRGLVLVTGPTGSGKSTTLAAVVDEINRIRAEHIVTIEDPIEFIHSHKRCIVNQREIGPDVPSFADGLRAALRQDPDVILVGEMRDLETISTALTAAETGHLVFGTLHTQSASVDDRPRDRRLPALAAAAGADHARQLASGRRHADPSCRRPRARPASPPSRCSSPTTPCGTSSARRRSSSCTRSCRRALRGACRRWSRRSRSSCSSGIVSLGEALSRTTRSEQLRGILERAGMPVDDGLAAMVEAAA